MRVRVMDECIGCGICADECPAVFEIDGSMAIVIMDHVAEDLEEDCRHAAEDCPVEAIVIEDEEE
jgi:ferredoxin